MSTYKHQYRLEMVADGPTRQIDADTFAQMDDWLIFYRKPPQGGTAVEYWRVRLNAILSMEAHR